MDNHYHLYEIAFHHANCNQFLDKYNDDKLFFKQHEYAISFLDIDVILLDLPVNEGTVANKDPRKIEKMAIFCTKLGLQMK